MDAQAELNRFRGIIERDVARNKTDGYPIETQVSGVVIAARHFARAVPGLATDLLRVGAEVTGVPLEPLTQVDGKVVQAWRPARGEVGWLPYVEPAGYWLAHPAPKGLENV